MKFYIIILLNIISLGIIFAYSPVYKRGKKEREKEKNFN